MVERTDDRILALVGRSDGLSRIALQRELGLPAATVTSAVGRLLARGDLVETPDPTRRSKSGRRPALLRVAGDRPLIGVVSWNRDHVRTALATFAGDVVAATEHSARGDDVLTEPMAALTAPADGRLTSVVVSVPAPYQRGKGVPSFRRYGPPRPEPERPRWLADFDSDPARAWSERLGVPTVFENDANLALIGEASAGVAAGLQDVVHIKLGGFSAGTGLLVGGRIHRGANGFAGELAHLHVDDDGPLCACGGRGCLQTRLGANLMDSVRTAFGTPVTFADILRLADAGEPGPARILGDIGRTIGRPLADLVTFLNPAAIVVDGSLGPAARFVVEGLREPIDRYASPTAASSLRVLVGTLGPRADLFGAIALSRGEALQGAPVTGSTGGQPVSTAALR
ncbi:ROK family transcriptional regulator [Jatrophihabitans sp. YIM 134969]